MKINVLGVKRVKGPQSKAGKPFDICSLLAMVPIENSATEKLQISGAGFELAEVPLDVEAMPDFLHLKFPAPLDLKMDTRPRFGKFESVCVGFVATPATVAKVG